MLESIDFQGYDGTRLRAYLGGLQSGPTIVIANGLGGSIRSWRHLVREFGRDFRIVSWDYRGLYGSDWPRDGTAFEVTDQARDLGILLDRFEVEKPTMIGWSMGVQVILEFLRESGNRVAGFVALHGTDSRPLATAFDGSTPRKLAPHIYRFIRSTWKLAMLPAPALSKNRYFSKIFVGAGVRLGVMSPTLDLDVFADMGQDWVDLNLDQYCSLFEALERHDASDVLAGIGVPTLVISGGKDRFTPQRLGEEMAAHIVDAETFTLPGATHFGLLEYPEAVNRRVRQFVQDRVRNPVEV